MGPQGRDSRLQIGDTGGEFALQGAYRRSRGSGGAGIDQIGNRFSLCDVDLAVQKSAFAELTGPRHAAAEFQQTLQDQIDDERAAVTLHFQNMFSGIRSGRGKEQSEALIEVLAPRLEE